MKKALLFFILLIALPSYAAPKKMLPTADSDSQMTNIFIYTIEDDEFQENNEDELQDDEITLEDEEKLRATTLKGFAQYVDDASVIYLKDDNDEFVLNIKNPQKIKSEKSINYGTCDAKPFQRYVDTEYLIAPNSISTSTKIGNFTIGAQFNNEVDNIAMLETETGLFTRYEKKRFALSSSVTKSLNTTYAQDYNTFSLVPELKLNNYISLKNIFSADVTRNRQSSKLVFSFNPFGKKDKDRFLFELGAKQTYYRETENTSSQFSFSTQFKL